MSDIAIVPIERLDIVLAPRPWAFADERRAEIDAYFAGRKRAQPALWNGRVLLLHQHAMAGGVFRGQCLETDFASFLAWRDWGCPPAAIANVFAMGALRAADGAFLLGVLGSHTANAGRIYFPAGTPDPDDVLRDAVDLDRSVWREVTEETGLERADVETEPGWTAVLAGPRIALMKRMQAPLDAEALRARILAHLARHQPSELSDIRIVRGPADLDAKIPSFVTAFLMHAWRQIG
jgi:8-oxo-dGTP pyrophosphatase MutT (NUDIX family)